MKLKTLVGCASVGVAALAMASCGNSNKICKEVVKYTSQLDALNQLNNGSVQGAIIDSIMAGYYTSKGTLSQNLKIAEHLDLVTEQYGIAAKKGNQSLINKINEGLYETKSNKMTEIAEHFGIESEIAVTGSYTEAAATDNAWQNIVGRNKVVIGYTVFAPIAFESDEEKMTSNKLTGYDIELARAVFDYLNNKYETNIEVEFTVIQWSSKELLLSNGSIDLVWNGLTITDERAENMCLSVPYLNNRQVLVIKKNDNNQYGIVSDLKNLIIGVEDGSAGEDVALGK